MRRLEDDRLLRGQGRFVDNLNFSKQAYLHVVRSYLGHAKIQKIIIASFDHPREVAA